MTSPEQELRDLGISGSVSAAYDLLTDAGVAPEKAATLAVGAERSGRDAETWARHYLKLARALRPPPPTDEDLAQALADRIIALEPMVVGWEVMPATDTVRLTLPHRLGIGIDLAHLRRGATDLVAERVVRLVRNAAR